MKEKLESLGIIPVAFAAFFACAFALPVGFAAGNWVARKTFGEYAIYKAKIIYDVNNRVDGQCSTSFIYADEGGAR